MSGGWGEVDYPQVVGHEIVGVAVKVGSKVSHVKVGDLVGVGAQNDSCRECTQCKRGREPYCDIGQVGTYNGKHRIPVSALPSARLLPHSVDAPLTLDSAGVYQRGAGKGDKSFGGYANFHRAPGHFVMKIPDGLDPALAAPMLCGGVTVYSPLTQYRAGQEDVKDVGIVGIGDRKSVV